MSEQQRNSWTAATEELGELNVDDGGIDTTVPHSARIWNYWLGGKDNFPVDQRAGDEYAQTFPGIFELARSSRAFIGRAVTHLAADHHIAQFLDIGTGLPTENNTHQVAQRANPRAHIVYVDNDPLVLTHAEALLTSNLEGSTQYIEADLRRPDLILERARNLLDFDQPIAVMLMGILGHIATHDQARTIIGDLMQGVPAGSFLALYDGTATNPDLLSAQEGYDDTGAVPYKLRHPDQITAFFDGLEVLPPGIVPIHQWRPTTADPVPVDAHGGIGRKP
ncbi:SAM-dependent methyltransferase [Actinomadura hibisca]|uniref:SAM-dependent methyltransferase n=1 Tax=Actinomadura hibisca TaxID=68565 RepID=UPI0009FBF71F|nr:SAM-dependent methyltransferase [Actinomadura hibisca]